ncbi:hypothetical protein K1T71_013806 [Dendrolimus kikuchii]|uniref:Uncharacterized protein n=1 Tax=Dendrolimus kikuchii TaxID=765133 RepID=A0ACC1CFR0_9NEOP|nr:hypothetical protein K1T71_013806 [Dendrolimus kikuchii]
MEGDTTLETHTNSKYSFCQPGAAAPLRHVADLSPCIQTVYHVAYAMSDVYSGIYSSKKQSRSLELKPYSQESIPTDLANTLYLTHTQSEKENLIKLGCGKGEGSAVQTIHEAQGLTFETVVIETHV